MDSNKDKRISWLSIFSSLTQNTTTEQVQKGSIADLAYLLTDQLFTKYPTEEDTPIKVEETSEKCPKCGNPKVIRQGEKNGKKWKGMFCSNPECDEKPKWLSTLSVEDVEEANYSNKG